ncbi:MAG: hypothetical protein A2298_00880 [Gammaproteobacteria bacterium RIFOXYB2_FULL_38_6]|nr:MAG: hypothetical protein A2298_00880 [Gammaproteobacteria bacterium RIFOXYB2_FULL_38_6]
MLLREKRKVTLSEIQKFSFTLRMQVAGHEVTPETIGLNLFNKFNREVEDFLAGSGRKVHWTKPEFRLKKALIVW